MLPIPGCRASRFLALGRITAVRSDHGLLYAGYPAMCLALLAYMLYRRDHFAGRAGSLRGLARPEGQA